MSRSSLARLGYLIAAFASFVFSVSLWFNYFSVALLFSSKSYYFRPHYIIIYLLAFIGGFDYSCYLVVAASTG